MKARKAFLLRIVSTNRLAVLAISILFLPCAGATRAQDTTDVDHAVVLELGGAGEWPTRGGATNLGGTVAVEYTPIENWLEVEAGVTALGSTGHTDLSGDFLLKKPWRIFPTAEFMVGAGPSLDRTLSGPDKGTSLGAEFALDFMFWPRKNIGWYVEPSWTITPRTWERTIGINGGLILGLP